MASTLGTLSPGAQEATEEDMDDQDEVGSTGSVDAVNIDPDRDDTRATGHLGKSSSVAWAKRTASEIQAGTDDSSITSREADFNLPSYYTEDSDISYQVDEGNLNIYQWPNSDLVSALINSYFENVNNILPIVDKLKFEAWIATAVPGSSQLSESDTIWLSTLNLMFAVAAYHAHLTNAPHRGEHYDHIIYCARAKKLAMDERLLYRDARLSSVCSMSIQCLYYLSICHINK